jgi:hypothetical protein
MAFSWKKFTIFGFSIAIPALVFILKVNQEQISAFAKHKEELANCRTCHKFFNHRAGVRLIIHLQEYHGLNENTTISIVDDLYKKLLVVWKKKDAATPHKGE